MTATWSGCLAGTGAGGEGEDAVTVGGAAWAGAADGADAAGAVAAGAAGEGGAAPLLFPAWLVFGPALVLVTPLAVGE